jgi:glycosyltransferase involved in cell wall biosynthesis
MKFSVIICTHNPRPDYLRRVLDALKAQTLPKERWELLLIDNASQEPLARSWDLSWHPHARHIQEDELGLTSARLRGIREAKGEILVFVDDDNVIQEDYLVQAERICREWPILGTWGGSIEPSFEVQPPIWAEPYLRYLALRVVAKDQWSNLTDQFGMLPWGAGLCVRRIVAVEYLRRTATSPMRLALDRKGNQLSSGGDTDFALTACDLGLGTGLFSYLRLTHLIPEGRMREPYLLKLMEGQVYSLHMLSALRGKPPSKPSWPRWIWGHIAALRRGFREFRFYRASLRGAHAASSEVARWNKGVSTRAATHPAEPVGGAHNWLPSNED